MVDFVLQPISWINTIVKIVQNCPVKSIISHNDLNSTEGMISEISSQQRVKCLRVVAVCQ